MHRPSFTADFFSHLENMVMAAHADPKQQEGEQPAVDVRSCATEEPAKPQLCKLVITMKLCNTACADSGQQKAVS